MSLLAQVSCRVEFDSAQQLDDFLTLALQSTGRQSAPHGYTPAEWRHVRRLAAKALSRCDSARLRCERSLELTVLDWDALLASLACLGTAGDKARPGDVRHMVFGVLIPKLRTCPAYRRLARLAGRYAWVAGARDRHCAELARGAL